MRIKRFNASPENRAWCTFSSKAMQAQLRNNIPRLRMISITRTEGVIHGMRQYLIGEDLQKKHFSVLDIR